MLRHNVDNENNQRDEVELSRRSFFSRFAVGAVLSVTMPGVVHAAKSTAVKTDKTHRLAHSGRSAVRLPKTGTSQLSKASHPGGKASASGQPSVKQQKVLAKTTSGQQGHLHTSYADYRPQHNSRVRDVYSSKKQGVHSASNHATRSYHQGGKIHSVIQPSPREPLIVPPQEPLFLADHGRLATHRTLAFQNPHTGDKLNLTYFEKGRYLSDALEEINFLLRDYRTDDVHPIDPELLDQLHDMKQLLGLTQPFDVVCGYRSPLTNAKLHAEHSGVANNSFHIYGRAVDIRIERFDLRRIHNAAIAMHRGGVGYYPESNFIHLDTGTFRTWSL